MANVPPGPTLKASPSCSNHRDGRPSHRGAHDILLAIADEAGIATDFTDGQVIRHTFGTRLIHEGHDLVLGAELMAHAGLEPIRAHSLLTEANREAAANSLITDC